MNFFGRRIILTSFLPKCLQPENYIGETLDESTITDELNKALRIHYINAMECQKLDKIYRGNQSILHRAKGDRIVNNRVVINYAQAFTRDITGYSFADGIKYVPTKDEYLEKTEMLNNFMKCENKLVFDMMKNEKQSIMGTSFLSIFPDSIIKNDVPFELAEISPEDAFVSYSSLNKTLPVYSWNVYTIKKNSSTQYIHQVFTRNHKWFFNSSSKYHVANDDMYINGPHILGEVPIIEYPNNQFRMGDWECAISLFDAINNMASDGLNDVEQTVLSYLAIFGIDFEKTDIENIRTNRVMCFPGIAGINQDAKFITAQIDGSSAQLLRAYLEQALKVVVGIPDRDTGQAGSDTGVSAGIRTGSGDMEIIANNKAIFTSMSERRLLKIALNILDPKYIKDLSVKDINISIPRNNLTDIVSKTQAGSTAYSMGIAKQDVLKIMNISNDIIGTVKRWEKAELVNKSATKGLTLNASVEN